MKKSVQKAAQQTENLEVVEIPLSKIEMDPRNPRKSIPEIDVDEMAETVRSHGIITPVSVRRHPKKSDTYILIYGQCRYLSAKRAELATIPAIIRDIDADTALEWMHIENLQRHSVNPVDEAEAIKALKGRKMSLVDIASKIGKTAQWVAIRMKLAELPESVKEFVRDEKITLRQAEEISKLDDQIEQEEVAVMTTRLKFSFEQTKREVENRMMSLAKVNWSLFEIYSDENGDMTTCNDCQLRTGSQAELFGEVSHKDDRCTNKTCYNRKKAAFVNAEIERLKKEKKKVVPSAKVEAYNSPYAKGKDEIAEAKAAKVKPEYVVDPQNGKVIEVYKKAKKSETTGKSVSEYEIEQKASELAIEAVRDMAGDDVERQMQVIFAEHADGKEVENNDKDTLITTLFNHIMDDAGGSWQAKRLLRAFDLGGFEAFMARAKVALGVVQADEEEGE